MRGAARLEQVMLFCPFCREAFDDVTRCPDHDVQLVTLRELGQLAAAVSADDSPLPFMSPRCGRWQIAVGALATLVAFVCPFGELAGETSVQNSLLTLARGRALRLWIVPAAAFALLLMLYRRRTPRQLRGARLGALFVGSLPSVVVAYTWYGAHQAATALATKTASAVAFHVGFGSVLVFASALILGWGSVRLGAQRRPRVR
jgi:hypothetical protein